ncbi:MAG: hypothetical protein ABUK01_18950 [Leptospirales bacterium]
MAENISIEESKIKLLFKKLRSNKPLFIAIVILVAFILTASVFSISILSKNRYSLHTDIKQVMNVIPENASAYLEIKNLDTLKKRWDNSELGARIKKNKSWENLRNSSGLRKITSVLYYLQLKSGELADYDEITSFFNNTIGFAIFTNDSWISVARTNLKSRFGAALLASFKSEKIDVSIEKENTNDNEYNNDNNSAGVYVPAFPEQTVSVSNLRVSKISVKNESIYFVLLDDFLFIANDLNVLKASLKLASGPSSKSLASQPGFDQVKKEYLENDVHAMVYFNNKTSMLAPLLNIIHPGTGTALTIKAPTDQLVSAKIYATGKIKTKKTETNASEKQSWEKQIPMDSTVTFFSRDKNIEDLFDSFQNLDKRYKSLKGGVKRFVSAADIKTGNLNNSGGFAFTLHDLKLVKDKPIPDFAVAYKSEKADSILAEAIFKSSGSKKRVFQKSEYFGMNHEQRSFYTPSYGYFNHTQLLTSSSTIMQNYIAVSGGNQPAISDANTFTLIKKYSNAPMHIVVNIPRLINNLIVFYNYGANKSSEYSKITINNDIKPLFNPFLSYKTIHVATGFTNNPIGTLVISDK